MYVYKRGRVVLVVALFAVSALGLVTIIAAAMPYVPLFSSYWWLGLGEVALLGTMAGLTTSQLVSMRRARLSAVMTYQQIMRDLKALRYDEGGTAALRLPNRDSVLVLSGHPLGLKWYQVWYVPTVQDNTMSREVYQLPADYRGLVQRSVSVEAVARTEDGSPIAAFKPPFKPFAKKGPHQLAFADEDDLMKVAGGLTHLKLTQLSKMH